MNVIVFGCSPFALVKACSGAPPVCAKPYKSCYPCVILQCRTIFLVMSHTARLCQSSSAPRKCLMGLRSGDCGREVHDSQNSLVIFGFQVVLQCVWAAHPTAV